MFYPFPCLHLSHITPISLFFPLSIWLVIIFDSWFLHITYKYQINFQNHLTWFCTVLHQIKNSFHSSWFGGLDFAQGSSSYLQMISLFLLLVSIHQPLGFVKWNSPSSTCLLLTWTLPTCEVFLRIFIIILWPVALPADLDLSSLKHSANRGQVFSLYSDIDFGVTVLIEEYN